MGTPYLYGLIYWIKTLNDQVITTVGWDIGGANLKAALFNSAGQIIEVMQWSCPLWQGLIHLSDRIHEADERWSLDCYPCHHAITMSGELVDLFPSRQEGVRQIIATMAEALPGHFMHIYAGKSGFLELQTIQSYHMTCIASANWLAMADWVSSRHTSNVLVMDIGSTTTDLILIEHGELKNKGVSDHERLTRDELVYTGCTRTPLMAIAQKAPVHGAWTHLMAEHFATMADIYRITGDLPAQMDLSATADGKDKSLEASLARIARMVGMDGCELDRTTGESLARYFRYKQAGILADAVSSQLSKATERPALVGAGIGRFLVPSIAQIFDLPYHDILEFMPAHLYTDTGYSPADAVPAVAVGCLWNDCMEQPA
ncbi:MAG: hypothetical protein RIQ52_858 [Pseudomonadota bacterium]